MNESTLIWLFGITGAWLIALTGVWWSVRENVKKITLAVDLFISGIGRGAAKVLHSPDDHLGIDKFLDTYIQNHHDLPFHDWLKLKSVCERLMNDKTINTDERLAASIMLAAFVAQVALHKTEPFKSP